MPCTGGLRHHLGDVLRRLAEQRESRVEEGHLLLGLLFRPGRALHDLLAGTRVVRVP